MRFLLLLLVLSVGFVARAQQSVPVGQNYYDEGPKGIVYQKELSFDFKLLTPRAFGLGVNIGDIKTYYLTRFINFEFGDLRHPMEYRQSFDFQIGTANRISRAFIYGKQNSVFVLRGGVGAKRYFSEKAKNRGLAVGASYTVGGVLGILKPYNLELLRTREPLSNGTFVSEEPYSEDNKDLFLDISRIVGAGAFSSGLEDLRIMPGIHARAAAHFDWGAFDELVKALEAGISVDVFFKDVPIMIEDARVPHIENQPIFINFFLSLQLGKRS